MKGKLLKTATIKDNAQAKRDLGLVIHAIDNGALDDVFSLTTWDRDEDHKLRERNMTISEIDEQVLQSRKQTKESIEFVLDQVNLFSQYLKRNFKQSSDDNGYSPNMIMRSITEQDFFKLMEMIETATKENESIEFTPGETRGLGGFYSNKADYVREIVWMHLQDKAGGAAEN